MTGGLAPESVEASPDALPVRDPDRYERVAEHARGGLGQVWRARDRDLGRVVALKELLKASAEGDARFVREALVTARLEHPSIVAVHDAGRSTAGQPYYTMKLIAGESLRDRIAACEGLRERLALLPNVIAVADAVAYAHDHGVIHRDLKPANVIVGDYGETVVVDWGLAKVMGEHDAPRDVAGGPYREADGPELTRAGAVLGTPAYMAPEQARGKPVDERADVYAIGAVLHHLLAGKKPYQGSDPEAVLASVVEGGPADLGVVAPDAPPDLVTIARKAMARDVAVRYRTAKELAADLRRFQTGQLVRAHDYTGWQRFSRWVRRHRTAVAVAMVAVVALAIVGALSVQRVIRARRVADARLTASLVDRGRQGLLAADYRSAAVNLSRAYARGADLSQVRLMLPLALRAFSAEVATLAHAARIWEVNYSADGSLLLVTAADGAHVWDGRTGAYRRSLRGHGAAQVRVARFDPTATLVATGGDDNIARLWRVSDGAEIAVLGGHDHAVREVGFSSDGALLATATSRGMVRVWTRDGELVREIRAHEGWVWRAVFSPRDELLATCGADALIRLWNPRTGALVHELRGHTGQVRNIGFDATSDRLVSVGYDSRAAVWNVATGERIAAFDGHESELVAVSFSPDNGAVLSAGFDGVVHIWDPATGQLRRTLRGHTGAVYWAGVSPDGETVVTTSWDGTARVWDARTGTESLSLAGHDGPVVWGALSTDGTLVATSSWDGTVRLWDTTQRNQRASISSATSEIHTVVFDGSGRRVLACTLAGARIHDAETGAVLAEIPAAKGLSGCAFDPAGARVATCEHGGSVTVWDAETGRALRRLRGPGETPMESIAFGPNGGRLAVVGLRGEGVVWDLASGSEQVFYPHAHGTSVAFSRDGTRLLTAGTDQTVKVWHLDEAAPVLSLAVDAHDYIVASAVFSPDGASFATASYDGTAKIWDATTGTLRATLRGHAGEVNSIDFHPSGQLVVTASTSVAQVWDVATAQPVARFSGHAGKLGHAAFSADGRVLATAGVDGVVKLWDTAFESRTPDEVADAVACLLTAGAVREPCERARYSVPPEP